MEIVDQEIERVLPAFRAAVHCELLTQDEVKQIIIKRKKDEAKLIKRRVDLTDYINFLHQDNMILKLIGKRRKATNYSHKMDEIEFQLVARLSRVMKRAQRLWPDNMSVWATHIALCEQWNKRTQLSKLYEELISRHPHNVDVWIAAAKFQVERNGSVDQARRILLRAQVQNKKSSIIYNQLFRIELLNAAQIEKRLAVAGGVEIEDESEKSVRKGAAAIGVVKMFMKNFPDDFETLYDMLRVSKSLQPPMKEVTDFLTTSLMESKELKGNNLIKKTS